MRPGQPISHSITPLTNRYANYTEKYQRKKITIERVWVRSAQRKCRRRLYTHLQPLCHETNSTFVKQIRYAYTRGTHGNIHTHTHILTLSSANDTSKHHNYVKPGVMACAELQHRTPYHHDHDQITHTQPEPRIY